MIAGARELGLFDRTGDAAAQNPELVLRRPRLQQGAPDVIASPRPPGRHHEQIAATLERERPRLFGKADVVAVHESNPEIAPLEGDVALARIP